MSIRLINRDTLLAIEQRIIRLLNTDNDLKEFATKSSTVFSNSVTRLSLDSLELKEKISNLQSEIFDRLNAIENHELYITLAAELTKLTNYYYEHEDILKNIINKSNADINKLQENISSHQDKLKHIEFSLSKLLSPPITGSVIGSSNVVRIIKNYNANSFDYIISNGTDVNVNLPLIKNIGDVISITNMNASPLTINNVLITLNQYDSVNLVYYKDEKWYSIPNNKNSNYEIISKDYQVNDIDKTKVLFIDSSNPVNITLPNFPCNNQTVTFINLDQTKTDVIKIYSSSYNIISLNISDYLSVDDIPVTLMFNNEKWVMINNSSNTLFISDDYQLVNDEMLLLVSQNNTSIEIKLPKTPPELFTTTIVDTKGNFSSYPCRLLIYDSIYGSDSTDTYLDIDIDNISITLQFINGQWLIKT